MNPVDSMLMIVNNGFAAHRNLMLEVKGYDMRTGKETLLSNTVNEVGPSTANKLFSIKNLLDPHKDSAGVFVSLRLLNENKSLVSENFYWLPGADSNYTALQQMKKAVLKVTATQPAEGKIIVTLKNDENNPVAFFNRVALVNSTTGERILPTFFSDNYVSVLPGESKTIVVEYPEKEKTIKK
jgi:hypothetical protein